MRLAVLLATAMLTACSGSGSDSPAAAPTGSTPPSATTPAAAPTPAAAATDAATVPPTVPAKRQADYVGRWTGVEGMYLVVTTKGEGVSLEMQYDLDNKGTFVGTVVPGGVRFTRNGVTETLRPTGGGATGLKYLAGKTDCLTVKAGEGYCRD